MEWPYKFPRHADVIAADVERFRHLTVSQRLERLFALIDDVQLLMSPEQRANHRQLTDESEAAWQSAQREMFLRFAP